MNKCKHGLEEPPEEWPDVAFTPSCYICWRETHPMARPVVTKVAASPPRAAAPPLAAAPGLGTLLSKALRMFNISEERVTAWYGKPCGCKEKREKLNALTWWAVAAIAGRANSKHLEDMLR